MLHKDTYKLVPYKLDVSCKHAGLAGQVKCRSQPKPGSLIGSC